ncbi:MAG: hypothetical protein FWE45_02110 [Firmicutes bacterium]|nr:hypothetical protein [Bacillota bacterium]
MSKLSKYVRSLPEFGRLFFDNLCSQHEDDIEPISRLWEEALYNTECKDAGCENTKKCFQVGKDREKAFENAEYPPNMEKLLPLTKFSHTIPNDKNNSKASKNASPRCLEEAIYHDTNQDKTNAS